MKDNLKKLVFTLVVALGFGLINVNAASDYNIYVNNTMLTSENDTITAGSGTVSYNESKKELTLNNATITSTMNDSTLGVISINNGEKVTIKLVGTNTITNTGVSQGILATSGVNITGSGSLSIATDGIGIYLSSGDLNIKDTNLTVKTNNWDAVMVNDNLVIDNSLIDFGASSSSAIYTWTSSVTFKNLTGKAFQKRLYSPITVDTDISDTSRFNAENAEYGYAFVKISNLYTVTADKDSNSTITLSDTSVLDGASVTATIGALDGYKVTSVLVNNVEKIDSVVNGKLTLTVTSNTTIKVVSEEIKIGVDAPVVNKDTKVEEVTVGVENNAKLEKNLRADVKEQYSNLQLDKVSVLIDVNNIKKEEVPETELTKINDLITKNGYNEALSYFDIVLKVYYNLREAGTITETSNKIKFQVALPDELKEVKDGYTRTYYIIRYHDNLAEVLDTKLGDNLLTFESDKFSTYAITYVDTKIPVTTKDETNPKTGDNVVLYTVISIISLLGIAASFKIRKKTN